VLRKSFRRRCTPSEVIRTHPYAIIHSTCGSARGRRRSNLHKIAAATLFPQKREMEAFENHKRLVLRQFKVLLDGQNKYRVPILEFFYVYAILSRFLNPQKNF